MTTEEGAYGKYVTDEGGNKADEISTIKQPLGVVWLSDKAHTVDA